MDDVPSSRLALIHQLEAGPPTLDVTPVAKMLGISRAGLYDAVSRGESPVRTIKVGTRIKVLTSSLVEVLEGVTSSETRVHRSSSERTSTRATTSDVKWLPGGDAA